LILDFGTESLMKTGNCIFNTKLGIKLFDGGYSATIGKNFGFREGYF